MGNAMGGSTHESSEFDMFCRRFSEMELEQIKKLYLSLAAQSRSNGQFVIASVFQAYYGLHGALGARLFDLVTQMRKDQRLTFEDFVVAKAKYGKGFPAETEEIMYKLVDLTGDGVVEKEEVEAVVLSILETVLGPEEAVTGAGLPDGSVQAFLNSVSWKEEEGKFIMSFQAFSQWRILVPSVEKFLASLLKPPSYPRTKVPNLVIPPSFRSDNILLRKEHAWHLGGMLQQHECDSWILLYQSSVNGFSFNTFLKNVSVSKGCTVLVIRDKTGCVYGGYASQAWEKQSDFYGDMRSFLFTLYPAAAIYRPSGRNANLQWCAINYVSESIPNGIGFGGQANHFGLFLQSTFDSGHTYPCVTFNSPALSSASHVVPDVIECWGVMTKSDEEGGVNVGPQGTVLERFKEERNMLNLVGIANASS